MPSKCKNKECTKGAGYNLPGLKQRIFCKAHKKPGMVSVKRNDKRKCQKCPKRSSFNFPGEKKAKFCGDHKESGMINVNAINAKKCACGRVQPSYALKCTKRATHCSKCADKTTMVDIVSKLCEIPNCEKNVCYGFKGKKAKRCGPHALAGMINVKNKRCEYKGCKTVASYGIDKLTHCLAHKSYEMVDKRHNNCMCTYEGGCDIRATYNVKNKKTPLYCDDHKDDDMVDVVSKMCEKCNEIQPTFNYKGAKSPLYCAGCSLDGMRNVVSKMCKACGLFAVPLKPHLCAYCKPKSSLRNKTREMVVVEHLREVECFEFIHNKSVGFVCGSYRPDIKIDAGTHLIIVEVDENQHKQYDDRCEIARMVNISQAEGLPCIFLRYNPDKFMCGKKRCKKNKTDVDFLERMELLSELIDVHMLTPPTKFMDVYKVFYDTQDKEFVQAVDIEDSYDKLVESMKLMIV